MKRPLAFISYRRNDEGVSARFIKSELEREFGKESVFMDLDNIRTSNNWQDLINQSLEAATVLIAIIGPKWLQLTDEHYRRRIDFQDDWVNIEISTALKKHIPIIPVLVGRESIFPEAALPENIRGLAKIQGIKLSALNWRDSLASIVTAMKANGFSSSYEFSFPEIDENLLMPLPLPVDVLNQKLKALPGWKIVEYYSREQQPKAGLAIEKVYRLGNFKKAFDFMQKVAKKVNELNHHPEWENVWGTVRIRFSTWDISHQVTRLDLDLAKACDDLYNVPEKLNIAKSMGKRSP